MINLLPAEDKRQLSASRANTTLLRYNFFLLGALAFLGLAIGATYFYLTSETKKAEEKITANQAKVSGFSEVEKQAQSFRANLSTAKQILDKEVAYTKAMLAISQLLPQGVIMQTFNLDSSTFGTPTTINVQAKNVEAAVNIKDTFQSSSLFSDVHFQTIGTEESPENPDYPVSVSMNVTINKEAVR